MRGFAILGTILATLVGGLFWAVDAKADTPTCVEQFWMMGLRATTRTICDGPLNPDGTWMRTRAFTAPAFTADGYSVCYSAVFCTFTAPREVAAYNDSDTYPVTATTVLPDEPTYLGAVT